MATARTKGRDKYVRICIHLFRGEAKAMRAAARRRKVQVSTTARRLLLRHLGVREEARDH